MFHRLTSVRNADLVEETIYATCRLAADNPELGHTRSDISNPKILFLGVGGYRKYLIAFSRGPRTLRVLRILHGARNIKTIFP